MYKGDFIRYRLNNLKGKREILGQQLDKAYIRGNVSSYLALEEKYARLSIMIENLVQRQNTRRRVRA